MRIKLCSLAVSISIVLMSGVCYGETIQCEPNNTLPETTNCKPSKALGASPEAWATAKALGRGVNFGGLLEKSQSNQDAAAQITNDLIEKARTAGFKTVRLPVRWSNHTREDNPHAIDEEFMKIVIDVVDRLLDKGFYVVLDMHHYKQLTCHNRLDSTDILVDGNILEDRFVNLWRQIAWRFKDKSNHLLFELYNEPSQCLDSRWNALAAKALAAVRESNPWRQVVIGPTDWNNADKLKYLELPDDRNLIVTIHNYDPKNYTHQGAKWNTPYYPKGTNCCDETQIADIVKSLDTAQKWSRENNYPVFVGEFGAYEEASLESRARYNRIFRDAAEARGMSWMYWDFSTDFGVYDPNKTQQCFKGPLVDALLDNPLNKEKICKEVVVN